VMLLGAFTPTYTRHMNTQPPTEDINAIVSRFQAWVGAQQAPARPNEAVRELTYDEAVRSRRRRTSPETTLPQAEKPTASRPTNPARNAGEKSATPKRKNTALRRAKAAQRNDARRPLARDRVVEPEPTTFRQVLAEKVSILPAAPQSTAIVERRTTALSLRISLAEHTLLKKRAAEANLSISCYLRNCVLEVETLRAQLARTLEEQRSMRMQPSNPASPFTSCMQTVRRLFFRRTTTLALRA